jgi:uncharacterized membrane protein HdeD (DUF308 family)
MRETLLLESAAAHRSLLMWRGTVAVAFAFAVFFWPGLTVLHLTWLWGAYSLVDGILVLSAATDRQVGTPRTWLGLIGLAGIACAGAVVVAPSDVADHLVAVISTWAILTGAMQVWAALQLRAVVQGAWILVLDGSGAILFGLAFALWPRLELVGLVWLTGWFAAMVGSLFLFVGLWLRR